MPRTKNFSELRDEARKDPKRARRIDEEIGFKPPGASLSEHAGSYRRW